MTQTLKLISDQVGDGIKAGHGDWSFSGDVAKTFVPHIKRSVPNYEEGHDLVCRMSDFFMGPESLAYEIGASTGELLGKMAAYHSSKPNTRWVGIDVEPPMVESAREHCKSYPNVKVLLENVTTFPFEKCDLIVSYYCIQFIPPRARQELINRLYEALHWGGALVMFEKVRAPDARFQDISTALYADFKTAMEYTDEEIMAKSRSLRGVLEPFTSQANEGLLRRAGFVDVWSIMKYVCFEGVIAVK